MHFNAINFGGPVLWLPTKLLLAVKLTILLLIVGAMSVSAASFAQKISMEKRNVPLKAVFQEIRKQSGYDFIFDESLISRARPVSVSVRNADLTQVLDQCLQNQALMYVIQEKIVVVKEKEKRAFRLQGVIKDEKGTPLPGVVVANVTKNLSVASDQSGRFSIDADRGDVIRFRMIGFSDKTLVADEGQRDITVVLSETTVQLQTTVVTALGIRREQRALGYAVSEVNGESLKKARETNVINSLAGKVPGLIINSTAAGPSGSSRVIIRGNTMLFPSGTASTGAQPKRIAAVEIKDQPRFGHRAFMTDIARNFQPVSQIMKVLDMMALYKLNVFHLHMSEDEGWRLEIPGLPELTEVGSRRAHPFQPHQAILPSYGSGPDTLNRFGTGHLSRADYIKILKYATARHIKVIPEVETPGHARAAIKAMDARYERLMKQGDKAGAEKYLLRDINDRSVYRSVQGFNDNVINPAVPSVYTFLEKVTDEIIAMHREAGAPLETIHFGGDEVPGGVWEQSPAAEALIERDKTIGTVDELWYYFFNRINTMLASKGLYIYGWEETGMHKAMVGGQKKMVVEPRFAGKNFHVDVWNNLAGNEDLAYKLANAGYKVVLTNVTNMYMDLAYSESYHEPGQYWGGYVDVEKLFRFIPFDYYKNQTSRETGEPLPKSHFEKMERLKPESKANIVGLQAPLWSEIITSEERLEYLLLPKVLGLAERAWAPDPAWANEQDPEKAASLYKAAWSAFVNVLGKKELPRLDRYAGGFQYRIPPPAYVREGGKLKANVLYPGLTIRYTTDGSEPAIQSKVFTGEMNDVHGIALRAFNQAGRGGRTVRP